MGRRNHLLARATFLQVNVYAKEISIQNRHSTNFLETCNRREKSVESVEWNRDAPVPVNWVPDNNEYKTATKNMFFIFNKNHIYSSFR